MTKILPETSFKQCPYCSIGFKTMIFNLHSWNNIGAKYYTDSFTDMAFNRICDEI